MNDSDNDTFDQSIEEPSSFDKTTGSFKLRLRKTKNAKKPFVGFSFGYGSKARKWEQRQVTVKTLGGKFTTSVWRPVDEVDTKSEEEGEDETNDSFVNENNVVKSSTTASLDSSFESKPETHSVERNFPIASFQQTHSSLETVTCPHKNCRKRFKDNTAMRKHLHIHRPRIHMCGECGKAFSESSKLRRHQLVHTGDKPFECPFEGCGRKFSLDFNLRTHVRMHRGERPYICPYDSCGKRFVQSTNLKTHLNVHTTGHVGPL